MAGLISTFGSTFPLIITMMYTAWFILFAIQHKYCWKFGYITQGMWLLKLLLLGPDHYIPVCLVNIMICYIGQRHWTRKNGFKESGT